LNKESSSANRADTRIRINSSSRLLALQQQQQQQQQRRPRRPRSHRRFRPYEAVCHLVRREGIRTQTAWYAWSKSGRRPHDVPSNPHTQYADKWKGWGKFLGTNNVRRSRIHFRSFAEARKLASSLGLKSRREWQQWSKSGKRPKDIPSNPQSKYPAWKGWAHFLSRSPLSVIEERAAGERWATRSSSSRQVHARNVNAGGAGSVGGDSSRLAPSVTVSFPAVDTHSVSTSPPVFTHQRQQYMQLLQGQQQHGPSGYQAQVVEHSGGMFVLL